MTTFFQALRLRTVTPVLIPEGFPDWQAVITVMEDKYVNLHFCLILSSGGMAKCLDCV